MQAEQQSDLLPCPFCGGEATRSKTMDESLWSHETVPYHKVYCPECEIGTEYRCEGWDPTAEESWNTRAALSHPSPQWLPIESAPKDGSVILIWRYYVCAVQWAPDEEWSWRAMPIGATYGPLEENAFMAGDPAITHWMPLPPPPEQGSSNV